MAPGFSGRPIPFTGSTAASQGCQQPAAAPAEYKAPARVVQPPTSRPRPETARRRLPLTYSFFEFGAARGRPCSGLRTAMSSRMRS